MVKANAPLAKGEDYMVKDVTLNWCKLGEPTLEFGQLQWSLQIETSDKKEAKIWKDKNLNVKSQTDGTFVVNIKRKAQNANGTVKEPPAVVDRDNKPIDMSSLKVANGSKGNVIIHIFPYEYMGKSGYSASLNGVQIIDLIEYKPSMGFSVVTGNEESDLFI